MDAIFQWAQHHQLLATAIGGIAAIGLYALPNTAVKMAAFKVSQLIRHVFGERLEKAIEDKISAFDEGMKGDNTENKG
jgi:hypothetical protein